MRAVIAIWIAVVLVLAQGVGTGLASTAPTQPGCRACDCRAPKCCVGKSAPAPVPAPAAPVNLPSPKQHLSMLPPSSLVHESPVFLAPRLSSAFFSLVSPEAVPLYERNCAFLI